MPSIRIDNPAPGVAYVVLDSPRTRNALGDELLDELLSALELLRDDEIGRAHV